MEKQKIHVIDLETGKLFELVTGRCGDIDERGIETVVIYNSEYKFCNQSIDKLRFLNTHLGEHEDIIRLTGAEIRSNYNRVKWAESLITQLPVEYEGRNSWLLNFGVQNEAKARREQKQIRFNEEYQAAEISPKDTGIEGEYKHTGKKEIRGNVKLSEDLPYNFRTWKELWKFIRANNGRNTGELFEFNGPEGKKTYSFNQICDKTLKEIEDQENAKEVSKLMEVSTKLFKEYIDNSHLLNCKCEAPKLPSEGMSNFSADRICFNVPIITAKKINKEKTISVLTEFQLESLILSTLEKYFSSKFHK